MANGALSGIQILDFTSYLAGPYGCTLLADLGADVIKIESPEGDMLLNYPSTLPGESRAFLGINRNKRGLVVDLKSAEGREVIHRLVRAADVVVENFRPSVPPRLGVDYETLRGVNAQLIYCALTGYGSRGPLRDHAGFDQVLQCMTGDAARGLQREPRARDSAGAHARPTHRRNPRAAWLLRRRDPPSACRARRGLTPIVMT